jgi:hypothetical protein
MKLTALSEMVKTNYEDATPIERLIILAWSNRLNIKLCEDAAVQFQKNRMDLDLLKEKERLYDKLVADLTTKA